MCMTYFNACCNCCCCNATRGQVGYGIQQFLPAGDPLYQLAVGMPQTLPMVSYVYDMYGMAYPVVNQAYPAPAMSLQDEHFMQNYNADYNTVNSELKNPSVCSITESGQPEFCQEFVENKSPPKPDISATSVTSMPLSTEEPIMQSPKLSDDTKANAVSEKKTKKGTKRKPKLFSSVSDETKKRKTDDPTDDIKANSVTKNSFHALGKKTIVTSKWQQIREPEEQAQLQCPKTSSPERGQVKAHSNLPKVKCEGVKKKTAPSLSKIAQNIQSETPIQKSPPLSEDVWEELLNQLEISIPLPPEEREALKRKARQEREEACQYTAKGRVQYFKQWQSDMDISLHYGNLPYLVHK
ncbi:hypothetical protein XELAEV_18031030mg [Xenopus laevis]|uniref:DUF4629 domain-containing protein n=1 Tax=Xenopus laevis TaxID=8355 RepID=A0A974HFC5_XENLA|nr:hypothetical protein XELAEV_18031030mg [Xenopus laevis]